MKRLIVIALFASAGCNDRKLDTGTMQEVAQLRLQVIELERQLLEQKETDAKQDKFANEIAADLNGLRKTFNGNVDAHNKQLLREATTSGLCGRETVQFADGSWTQRNRECTWKLLGK